MNRKRKLNRRKKFNKLSDDEKIKLLKIRKDKKKRVNVGWCLPSEITHIICFSLTTKDAMNLAICNKLLNSHIDSDIYWQMRNINTFNKQFTKDNEGKWKIMYSEYYSYMMKMQDKLLWVIDNNYYRLIPDVLASKNFITSMQRDPITYLIQTLEKKYSLEMIKILFEHNWDIQE